MSAGTIVKPEMGRSIGLSSLESVITTSEHVDRGADPFIDRLLDEEPAILLEGPRGSGKTGRSDHAGNTKEPTAHRSPTPLAP